MAKKLDKPAEKPPLDPERPILRDEIGRVLPGSSLNPNGRPRKLIEFKADAASALEKSKFLERCRKVVEDDKAPFDQWLAAGQELANRAHGKPGQSLEVSGAEDGPPMQMQVDLRNPVGKILAAIGHIPEARKAIADLAQAELGGETK